MDKIEGNLIRCPYLDKPCINRDINGGCISLRDASFDGECHFRKESVNGPFVYDLGRGERGRMVVSAGGKRVRIVGYLPSWAWDEIERNGGRITGKRI